MTEKKFKISVADFALQMIDMHIEFLGRVSICAAENTLTEIQKDLKSLTQFPERNPYYVNPFLNSLNYRKMISGKRYLIIYEIVQKTVFVDYILDSRQENKYLFLLEH